MDLERLQEFIAENWAFDGKNYPHLPGHSDLEYVRFGVDHISKHLQKEAGKLAEFLEELDHRRIAADDFSRKRVREKLLPVLRDEVMCGLRLAALLGITGREVEEAIMQFLAPKQS